MINIYILLSPKLWHPFEWHFVYVADGVVELRFVYEVLVQRLVLTINFEHLSHVLPTTPNHAYSIGLEVVAMLLPVHCSLFKDDQKKEKEILEGKAKRSKNIYMRKCMTKEKLKRKRARNIFHKFNHFR